MHIRRRRVIPDASRPSLGVRFPAGSSVHRPLAQWIKARRGRVQFKAPLGPSAAAPTVITVTPAQSAHAATSTTVTATFSVAMNSGTITTSTFLLKHGSTPVAGSVAYNAGTTTATFTPTSTLTAGATFNATLTTAIQSAAGTALAAAVTWTFNTTGGKQPHRYFSGLNRGFRAGRGY